MNYNRVGIAGKNSKIFKYNYIYFRYEINFKYFFNLQKYPVNLTSKTDLILWFCYVHNIVKQKLKKNKHFLALCNDFVLGIDN